MARGHVTINGQDYVVQDESLVSKTVPMFRPQLVVEGISREAQDQYLYMAQDTWDKGSYVQAREVAHWQNGGWGRIDGIDNSVESRIQLQRRTVVSLVLGMASDGSGNPILVPTRLVSFAGWLIAFSENGDVKRTWDGVNWDAVTYDFATHGAVSFVDIATTFGGGGLAGSGTQIAETSVRLLIGTKTGKVFLAKATDLAGVLTIAPPTPFTDTVATFGPGPVRSALAYRDNIVVASGDNLVVFREMRTGGVWGVTRHIATTPGAPMAMAVWNQLVMVGVQTSSRGSIILAADPAQAIDSYRVDGGFAIQSMTTWGGSLIYAGKTSRSSSVFTFPGTLADRLPPGFAPADVVAMLATHRHVLVGWNGHGGLWWIHDKGSGAYAQYDIAHATHAGTHRRVRSIAMHRGELYYTLDDVGVIRVMSEEFRTAGTITSGWFDGGFPELQKNFADVFVRLKDPLKATDAVKILARVDGKPEVSLGSLATGRVDAVIPLPASLQQGKRINLTLSLTTAPITASPGVLDNWNRADNNSLGADWTETESATTLFAILSNQLRVTAGSGFARRTAETFSTDQFSALQFIAHTNFGALGGGMGPGVRMSGTDGSFTGYVARYAAGSHTLEIVKYLSENLESATTGTVLAGPIGLNLSVDQVLKISVIGSAIKVFVGSLLALSVTDTAITTGAPGFIRQSIGPAVPDLTWENWNGGTIITESPPTTTDNFNRADGPSLGAPWVEIDGGTPPDPAGIRINTNQLFMTVDITAGGGGIAYQNIAADDEQFVELARGTTGPFGPLQSGPAARIATTSTIASATLYALFYDISGTPQLILKKYVNQPLTGLGTTLGTFAVTLASGDKIRLVANGSTISAKRNGVTLISVTDTAITSGKPGVACITATLNGDQTWDNWGTGKSDAAALGNSTPVVTAVVLRYRPIPFLQRLWAFTVKAAENLLFLDGSRERRTPATILANLFALPNVGQVDFSSVLEPTSKKVYVTNVELKDQLMGRSRPGESEESHIAVEILEASAVVDNTAVANPPQEDLELLPLDSQLDNPDRGPGDGVPAPGPGDATPWERDIQPRSWEQP